MFHLCLSHMGTQCLVQNSENVKILCRSLSVKLIQQKKMIHTNKKKTSFIHVAKSHRLYAEIFVYFNGFRCCFRPTGVNIKIASHYITSLKFTNTWIPICNLFQDERWGIDKTAQSLCCFMIFINTVAISIGRMISVTKELNPVLNLNELKLALVNGLHIEQCTPWT